MIGMTNITKPTVVPYSPTLSTPPHVMTHLEELVDISVPEAGFALTDSEVEGMQSIMQEQNLLVHLALQEKFKPAQERRLTALDRVRRNDSAYAHLYRNRHSGQDRLGAP